jgi:hypothetical protein
VSRLRLTARLALLLATVAVVSAAIVGAAGAAEIVQDPDARLTSLQVNRKGEALLTYRRSDGRLRHVLVWGAVNARPPTQDVPQVRFHWDYAGGWGKYRQSSYWKSFRNSCRPYDGPQLALFVTGCKAPDGSYWTVQAWQRRLPLLGFEPWLPAQSSIDLLVAHWSGPLPVLEAYANWTYGGRFQGIFGRLTYLGQPVYGFGANAKGVPKDRYGRNVYIDTYNSVYGPGWKREAGILTHQGTGTFCHSFVPQHPFPSYPSQDVRPAAPGERYRVTVGGPGVMPVLQVEVPGLIDADRARDPELGAVFDRVMAGDRTCASER